MRSSWRAYDDWKATTNPGPSELAGILDREYIRKGSQGVQDFIPNRIISSDALAKKILADPKYYESIRANTERIQALVPTIRASLKRLKELYPDAVFPPVYFVVGRRNSGGTSSTNGLIVGAEMFADEGSRLRFDGLVPTVVHELIHYQQQATGVDLTTQAMKEGAADFVAEMITGTDTNEDLKTYGDAHEQELWTKFQQDRDKSDLSSWLYNYDNPGRNTPPDLGYYIGYKICQSFYEISSDKSAAIQSIIAMKNPKEIIEKSGYAQRFH